MSRKVRFFKDQISKVGHVPSPHPILQPDLELEELEVTVYFTFNFCIYNLCFLGFEFELLDARLPAIT